MLSKTYGDRAQRCKPPLAKKILQLMSEKESNLALSADVCSKAQLLELADVLGPQICVLKTHLDIINDFDPSLIPMLTDLAKKHHFLILEDRKFADIGSTVQHQYRDGLLRIADWADLVTVHGLPGSGIVRGLEEVGLAKGRGCLLLADMSSSGNLLNEDYRRAIVRMAEEHPDFVVGFIAQARVETANDFLHFTPGIGLAETSDTLGQNYRDPQIAVRDRGTDVIIVGRHIYKSDDPLRSAKKYRELGWRGYLERLH